MVAMDSRVDVVVRSLLYAHCGPEGDAEWKCGRCDHVSQRGTSDGVWPVVVHLQVRLEPGVLELGRRRFVVVLVMCLVG